MESKSWRRGFLGGFAALAFAVAGQMTASRFEIPAACPVEQQETPVAQALIEKVVAPHGLTQRVALAVIGAMLMHTCS